jgi:Signal transduction histidine kinase
MLFFILRYNFEYKITTYNIYVLPILLFYLSIPLIYARSKNFTLAASMTLVSTSAILAVLLYSSGGLHAPGIFWLTAIPITGLILFGRQGGMASSLLMVAIFGGFWIAEKLVEGPNIVRDLDIYEQEKRINLICFLCYSMLITYYFKRNEDAAAEAINNHRKETENILRILIHDVANPATFIQFGLDEMKNPALNEREREFIHQRLEKNIENVIAILQQVRQIKALKDGKINLEMQTVDATRMLQDIVDIYAPKIMEKALHIKILTDTKHFVWADKVILQNVVLTNIISNAIKFSPNNSEILIHLISDGEHLEISVQDFGIGIPHHIQTRIFDISANTSRSGTRGEKGTGYGLPLAMEYTRKMNGNIVISSQEDHVGELPQGTKVVLNLPLSREEPGV